MASPRRPFSDHRRSRSDGALAAVSTGRNPGTATRPVPSPSLTVTRRGQSPRSKGTSRPDCSDTAAQNHDKEARKEE
eukprot:4857005-Pyramimonas_sp.AAC.1